MESLQAVNPQGLVDLISYLTNFINLPKLVQSKELQKFDKIVEELEKHSFLMPNAREVVKNLQNSLKCCFCLTQSPAIFLVCRHNLCEACMSRVLQESTISAAVCPVCQEEIPEKVYSDTLEDWSRLQRLENHRSPSKTCAKCAKSLNSSCFYPDFPTCHPFCKRCLWEKTLENDLQCPVCPNKILFPSNPQFCSNCAKSTTQNTSWFLCPSHSYCYKCCKIGISSLKCLKCEEEFTNSDYAIVIKYLHETCSYCNHHKEKPLFTVKNCCQTPICLSCQCNYSMSQCKFCKKKLEIT